MLPKRISATDEKQKQPFNGDESLTYVNQEHSVPVNLELESREPPEILWQGTVKKHVERINDEIFEIQKADIFPDKNNTRACYGEKSKWYKCSAEDKQ